MGVIGYSLLCLATIGWGQRREASQVPRSDYRLHLPGYLFDPRKDGPALPTELGVAEAPQEPALHHSVY